MVAVRAAGLAGLLCAALWTGAGAQEAGCRCEATKAEVADADAWLWLSPKDKAHSQDTHLPWGLPDGSRAGDERLLVQRDYVLSYDVALRTPIWAAYRLQREDLAASLQRKSCFRMDPRLKLSEGSVCAAYDELNYEQGQIVPAGDMGRTLRARLNTFMMSNTAPQHCAFARGTWRILESLVRDWTRRTGGLYVISGSVFDRDGNGRRDPTDAAVRMTSRDRVAVPSHYFKIIAEETAPGAVVAISFLLPNTPEKIASGRSAQREYLTEHLVSILTIEALVGLRFFPDLPQDQAITLKQGKARGLWPVQGKWPDRRDGACH